MCPINVEQIRIDHVVDFTKDHTTFAAARDNGSGYLRIFLINDVTGRIYNRNGRADSWEELLGAKAEAIRVRIAESRVCGVPVYRVNGFHAN